jgi:phenylacetate-CoA ligase
MASWEGLGVHGFFIFSAARGGLALTFNDPDRRCDHSADALGALQLQRLNALLSVVQARPFYREQLAGVRLPLRSLDELAELPLLTKSDLVGEAPHRAARIFDLPRSQYRRLHQTSGTRGFPMIVLDTQQDWDWWIRCWDFVLDAAEVTAQDVAMMAFSFGPFIGFWTAHDALVRRGTLVVPGGGVSSEGRLQMIRDHACTILCCTASYALHLADVAARAGIPLASTAVSRIIVAGEPGGSIPAVRERIEQAWDATVVDHAGASELGAWGFGSVDGRGLHVIETEFIAELLRFDDQHPCGRPVADGEPAELVLTNLGRYGGPAIRYRTGDVVRGHRHHAQPCRFLWLEGGVLGRADDMMVIRGVNVFPSSIEAMVRELDATAEFRMIVTRVDCMDQLSIEVEMSEQNAARLRHHLRDRLSMRVSVAPVAAGSLPRFQAKAKRLVDRRNEL